MAFRDSYGVSEHNAPFKFVPAFQDAVSGRVELSRFRDGRIAPFHTLDGVPEEWIVSRNKKGKVESVKASVVSGFLYQERFLNREEAVKFIEDIRFIEDR
ncbi:hypothetical protein ACQUQP_15360 [Marinobacterium sp. YM272]|uniref:hypothetical protein n=1 Tax=Marinobacterium sp. YM272 TaxID=3421654 RepID=UPI003D7F8A01